MSSNFGQPNYREYSDLPWYERAAIAAGSGLESVGKGVLGMVHMQDYAPSGMADAKTKIESDIQQKGFSPGFDWKTYGRGTMPYKAYQGLFGGEEQEIPQSTGASLKTGGGISGGEEANRMKIFGGGVSQPQQPESGISLGKPIGIEPEVALEEENYSLNNFSF